ncbi:MAG: hypothetical protein IMX00_00135 [Limnochordales bacterium]|nr:hypothetical protein [Limnochordales bacterium]
MDKSDSKPAVMVLGTFHIARSGIDIMSPRRQAEIRQCIERIKLFRPSKVAVEVVTERDEELNEEYRQYLAGDLTLKDNEVHQLAFRIAAALGHERLYAVDWMKSRGQRAFGDVYEWAKTNQPDVFQFLWGDRSERGGAPKEQTILDMLRSYNDPENVRQNHQFYMHVARIGAADDYVGIDWLRWWYERNLIIYANIARLAESPADRILLIIGADHVYLVSQFLRESGLFEVESAHTYLSKQLDRDEQHPTSS